MNFRFPKVVAVSMDGDPEFITAGFGLSPFSGLDQDSQSHALYWHESTGERMVVVDFLLDDNPDLLRAKAADTGVISFEPMTVDFWNKKFAPQGWKTFSRLADLEKFLSQII